MRRGNAVATHDESNVARLVSLSEDTPHRCAQQAKHGDMDDTGHDGR